MFLPLLDAGLGEKRADETGFCIEEGFRGDPLFATWRRCPCCVPMSPGMSLLRRQTEREMGPVGSPSDALRAPQRLRQNGERPSSRFSPWHR
jgi:hypothetical protein